jgi:hypothetical protein
MDLVICKVDDNLWAAANRHSGSLRDRDHGVCFSYKMLHYSYVEHYIYSFDLYQCRSQSQSLSVLESVALTRTGWIL